MDPDYSADFALALMTLSTVVVKGNHNIRLLTMSWEQVNPVTLELFHALGVQLQQFRLPDIHDMPMRIVIEPDRNGRSGLDEWLEGKLIHGSNQAALGLPCTVLCFQEAFEKFDWPENWEAIDLDQENFWEMSRDVAHKGIKPSAFTRSPTLTNLPGSYYVVISDRRTRRIFDRDSRQIVEVSTKCSESEMIQQISWYYRARVPMGYEKMIIDSSKEPSEDRRLMRICNDQLGGFLAALTDFSAWPREFLALLWAANGPSRGVRLSQMKGRLEEQGLTVWADSPISWGLSNSVGERIFHKVLPMVDYDHCVAHFLSLPRSSLVVAAKVQMAALIVSGRCYVHTASELEVLNRQGVLDYTYRVGLFKEFGYDSTLTMALGAMKLEMAGPTPSYIDVDTRSLGFSVEREDIARVQGKCRLLINAFREAHIPIVDVASFSPEEPSLTPAQRWEVLLDFGRAFVHQMTETDWRVSNGEARLRTKDILSRCWVDTPKWVRACYPREHLLGMTWPQYGIYTRASAEREGDQMSIQDWTRLPDSVVQQLDREREERRD